MEAEQFDRCYSELAPRLVGYAYALTGNYASAQDIVQEAFVRAWQRWRTVGRSDSVEAWLRTVISRLATDRHRHLAVVRRFLQGAAPPPTQPAPTEANMAVVAALKQVPMAQRKALALYYLCDMSVAEIAAECAVAPGTVKSWLARGRNRIAQALDASSDDSPTLEVNNA